MPGPARPGRVGAWGRLASLRPLPRPCGRARRGTGPGPRPAGRDGLVGGGRERGRCLPQVSPRAAKLGAAPRPGGTRPGVDCFSLQLHGCFFPCAHLVSCSFCFWKAGRKDLFTLITGNLRRSFQWPKNAILPGVVGILHEAN